MASPRLPPDAVETHESLDQQLNASVRSIHTLLNDLIVQRFPLALPPHTASPFLYRVGLAAFADLYFTFEAEWLRIIEEQHVVGATVEDDVTVSALIHLHMPKMQRSAALSADLEVLATWCPSNISLLSLPAEERSSNFLDELRASIRRRPHILVAYAWTLYGALFGGGPWLYCHLLQARDTVWTTRDASELASLHQQEKLSSPDGLSFWHFDGPDGGRAVYREFKTRLSEIERLLSPQQRVEIEQEAQAIFERCDLIVKQLDQKVYSWHLQQQQQQQQQPPPGEPYSWLWSEWIFNPWTHLSHILGIAGTVLRNRLPVNKLGWWSPEGGAQVLATEQVG